MNYKCVGVRKTAVLAGLRVLSKISSRELMNITCINDECGLIFSCDSGNSHSVSREMFWKKHGLVP